MENERFKELKVGDYIFVINRYNKVLEKVDRVTKTMVICDGLRFSNNDGYVVGSDGYSLVHITIPTKEEIDNYYKEKEVQGIKRSVLGKVALLNDITDLKLLQDIDKLLRDNENDNRN